MKTTISRNYALPAIQPLPFAAQAEPSGIIYLLHFERPIGNPCTPYGMAQHYMGHAKGDVPELISRINDHARGGGDAARIMAEVERLGIRWHIVMLWRGSQDDEYFFKKHRKCFPTICPTCRLGRQNRLFS